MKLWSGRFNKELDKGANDFNSSISFDARMYKHDILGSIAHAKMLGHAAIIPKVDSDKIVLGLEQILEDIENDLIEFSIDAEDIHMNIESILIKRIGEAGKRLHTGRSRNDQVALDTRMYIKDEILFIMDITKSLNTTLLTLSQDNLDTIMPGYTHMQKAQPITLAHHLMAYYEMFKRDIERLKDCYKRTNVMPLGSGALATTTYPLDREYVRDLLGFYDITYNSIDSVSDRDYLIELANCLSIMMMHLSRFCEEIILWSSNEFSFIELDDAFSTGSSIMPQKKNPDIAELVRGKAGRVFGNQFTLLSMMKSLPLAYNKDMQEDKPAIFDSVDTVKLCLPVFNDMLATCTFNKDIMYNAASKGFTNATDLADYLVRKGIPFRTCHEITGKIVAYCSGAKKAIEELSITELQEYSSLIESDVYEAISLETCVNNRKVIGGPSKDVLGPYIEKCIKNI